MELVLPSVKYKESFIEAVKEFLASPVQNVRSQRYAHMPSVEELEHDFPNYVQSLHDRSRGIGLIEGYVPATDFWLVDGEKYIGCVSIRHRLTEHLLHQGGHIGYDIRPSERGKGLGTLLLSLALPEAKKLGIDGVLVTCDSLNDASRKIIEKNGGEFENEVLAKDGSGTKLRYWIRT